MLDELSYLTLTAWGMILYTLATVVNEWDATAYTYSLPNDRRGKNQRLSPDQSRGSYPKMTWKDVSSINDKSATLLTDGSCGKGHSSNSSTNLGLYLIKLL